MPDQPTLAEDLKTVFDLLGRMFDQVDEQLADVVNALFNGDAALAGQVREQDARIDALELKVDRACELILARHHPERASLRNVIAAMRINADLERIGDLCKNVAKSIPYIEGPSQWHAQTHIMDMADVVRAIVREAREVFIRQDRLGARKVLARDKQVDREHKAVVDAIIALCRRHPEHAEALVHLIMMSKALERIADHAKNIARSMVFLIEGADIRHQKAQRAEG